MVTKRSLKVTERPRAYIKVGCYLRPTISHLRVTIGHLRITMGHLRVTVGHLRATMGHLRLTIGYLKATVVHIRVTLGNSFSELHPKVRQTCSNINADYPL